MWEPKWFWTCVVLAIPVVAFLLPYAWARYDYWKEHRK